MNDESGQPPASDDRDGERGPPSAGYILIGAMILALACFGAYFFVLKLIDMSRQEDCFMSGRRNCAPLEVPYDR
jgi:hypothetical protein